MSESRLSKRVYEYINDGKDGCVVKSLIEGLSGDAVKCYELTCDRCHNDLALIITAAIDEEVDSERRIYMRNGIKDVAAYEGWPTMLDGESFVEWMGRCWLPRPRYEDGSIVDVEGYVDGLDSKIDIINVSIGSAGDPWYTIFDETDHIEGGGPFKRRSVELGADNLAVNVGDTVWLSERHIDKADNPSYSLVGITRNEAMTVIGFRFGRVVVNSEGGVVGYADSECLTHNPPDTQQTINDAATMAPATYCAARGINLGDDPDREKATVAMIADLLRRQRELDARMGGE